MSPQINQGKQFNLNKPTPRKQRTAEEKYFIDDYLAYLLAHASQAVSAEFHSVLPSQGVTVTEWRILSTLYDHPQISVGKLSKIVICKQPTLSKLIDRMEAKKWIVRSMSHQDRRSVHVSIDSAGMEIVRDLIRKAKELERSELNGFSKREIHTLKNVLRKLILHCGNSTVLDKNTQN